MLYNFELGYNIAEATKNIRFAKVEGTISRWLNKFHLVCKKVEGQVGLKL